MGQEKSSLALGNGVALKATGPLAPSLGPPSRNTYRVEFTVRVSVWRPFGPAKGLLASGLSLDALGRRLFSFGGHTVFIETVVDRGNTLVDDADGPCRVVAPFLDSVATPVALRPPVSLGTARTALSVGTPFTVANTEYTTVTSAPYASCMGLLVYARDKGLGTKTARPPVSAPTLAFPALMAFKVARGGRKSSGPTASHKLRGHKTTMAAMVACRGRPSTKSAVSFDEANTVRWPSGTPTCQTTLLPAPPFYRTDRHTYPSAFGKVKETDKADTQDPLVVDAAADLKAFRLTPARKSTYMRP